MNRLKSGEDSKKMKNMETISFTKKKRGGKDNDIKEKEKDKKLN